ncbi:GUN4 domain-containing protein [Planktothrix agardhii]|jgi:hypothetical protein|uniref:GUN4 domain-containing protein n=1 Tax=Planktothrix agardhii TaxID=1160 RepID=UPI001D0AC13A|nr:GUN4 domain-containing protein [Planktothrix agardhii]MCB8762125.1 GUN4 domain-containing protein [Planktothrix agardhii 1813]MCB8780227.1 GUN4 domain-containing protein [Planktothrix agardhii 1031]MCF3600792.1 GUN4 domain-containing protein [Planktothrix agardhii 1032]MCF3608981.1 GUN4 domain-containing protein [Planktothrix agardhii 1033]
MILSTLVLYNIISVQKEIYESLGGTREYNPKIWRKFCDQVGWRIKGKWINYDELTFK